MPTSSHIPSDAEDQIRKIAIEELGFDACGFAPALLPPDDLARRDSWLKRGLHADMDWLKRHEALKQNPAELLPGVQSAIVVIKSYRNTPERELSGQAKVARYAAGQDYHALIGQRLRELEERLKTIWPESDSYSGVDSRPIAERELATLAGIGFRGRHTLMIRPGLGSYFFIGVVLTTLKLEADTPSMVNCGTCRKCVDACPTDAILESHELDAGKCISFWNIEQKEPLSPAQIDKTDGWAFGCDICQEVCPFNKENIPLTDWLEFHPDAGLGFDLEKALPELAIPRNTSLHRSRKRVRPNVAELLKNNME